MAKAWWWFRFELGWLLVRIGLTVMTAQQIRLLIEVMRESEGEGNDLHFPK